jgi:hypothetical protein
MISMPKIFSFNNIYFVVATTKEEAKEKLRSRLDSGHQWYLNENAENSCEQGSLSVKECAFENDVFDIRELKSIGVMWKCQVSYKQRGFKQVRFEELGNLGRGNKSDFTDKAKKVAEDWIFATFKDNEIEEWCARVCFSEN